MKTLLTALLAIGVALTANISTAQAAQSNILIAYFSRVGNEYGVGNITKGNTAIIAEMLAEETGGDLFEIKPLKPYPNDYNECTKVASKEKAAKARPEIIGKVDNFENYEMIFIGYPIWYGDMPMAVYTFLESYDFSGKKIVPFCTHGGSGLSSTDQALTLACPKSEILRGFEIKGTIAQKQPEVARTKIINWISNLMS